MEIPTKITLKAGEAITLRLPGLGPAGYTWLHEIVGDVEIVNISTVTEKSSDQNQEEKPTVVGSGEDELFIIRAINGGHTTVSFFQKRTWEHDKPPLKEHIIEIYVNN